MAQLVDQIAQADVAIDAIDGVGAIDEQYNPPRLYSCTRAFTTVPDNGGDFISLQRGDEVECHSISKTEGNFDTWADVTSQILNKDKFVLAAVDDSNPYASIVDIVTHHNPLTQVFFPLKYLIEGTMSPDLYICVTSHSTRKNLRIEAGEEVSALDLKDERGLIRIKTMAGDKDWSLSQYFVPKVATPFRSLHVLSVPQPLWPSSM